MVLTMNTKTRSHDQYHSTSPKANDIYHTQRWCQFCIRFTLIHPPTRCARTTLKGDNDTEYCTPQRSCIHQAPTQISRWLHSWENTIFLNLPLTRGCVGWSLFEPGIFGKGPHRNVQVLMSCLQTKQSKLTTDLDPVAYYFVAIQASLHMTNATIHPFPGRFQRAICE